MKHLNKLKTYIFLFLAIPLCLLLLLGLNVDTKKTRSQRERRNLTSLPEQILFNNNGIEKYIADHIPFREKILDYYFRSGFGVDFGTANVLIGKNGWLFQNSFVNAYNLHNIKSYQNKELLKPKEKETIIENINIIQKWCDENNIKLYVMFPPDKHRIYSQFMPDYILRENNLSIVKQIEAKIPSTVTVVSLEDELTAQSRASVHPLYYKTESHWAETGAFYAYTELMKHIQYDFPTIKPLTKSDFYIVRRADVYSPYSITKEPIFTNGNLCLSNIPKNKDKIYEHYIPKNKKDIKILREKSFRSSDNINGLPHNVYIIGDSYATYLHSFLSATFRRVKAYRFNEPGKKWGIKFNERKKEMLDDKTNILILSVSDLKLKDLLRIF